ncbi:MAG: hypothetical protein CBB88_04045 [Rhizobiales bacterium TMED28]|nr:MAG: hypothetical protein CBB88_04045 [Rhizobiales bacterium TMED28]
MNQKAKEAFKTISEVSGELNIPQHVLRFWEKKFKQIKPMTRGGGRRLYRPEDVELLRAIHKLLYTEMYTISGVQKIFRERGKNFILEHDESRKNLKSLPQVQQDASQESNYTADLFNNKNSSETDSDFNNFLIDSISELESLKEILQRSNT